MNPNEVFSYIKRMWIPLTIGGITGILIYIGFPLK